MQFRFASWNVNNRLFTAKHCEFIRGLRADIFAFQEVSEPFHAALVEAGVFAANAFSLALRPPLEGEGRARRLGCALFCSRRFMLESSCLLPELAFPERALVAFISGEGRRLISCSFHTPPGASWGPIKPQTLTAIAQWLSKQSGSIVFGIDANCPKTDHPDHFQNEWWWAEEPLLLGPTPLHSLKDAFRLYLEQNAGERLKCVAARPNGPLAVSHARGRGRSRTDCRYDFIYVTPDIQVRESNYQFDGIVKTLSDHAAVVADLTLAQ